VIAMIERPLLEGLYREHRSLRAAATSLRDAIRGLAASPDAAADEAVSGQLRGRLWRFHEALLHHFRQEQEGLYPEAQQLISQGAERGDVFGCFFAAEAEEDLGAHAALGERLEEMMGLLEAAEQAQQLETGPLARLRSMMGLTHQLFDRHADKEDRFIYPMLQQALTSEQRHRVRQRLVELR
jgi:hemerythrin-like domain-containing protein